MGIESGYYYGTDLPEKDDDTPVPPTQEGIDHEYDKLVEGDDPTILDELAPDKIFDDE